MICELLTLSVACVWWVNICPIIDIAKVIARMQNYKGRLKPFDCATCMGFWSGLAFAIITHESFLYICTYAILCSFFSTAIEKLYLILLRHAD